MKTIITYKYKDTEFETKPIKSILMLAILQKLKPLQDAQLGMKDTLYIANEIFARLFQLSYADIHLNSQNCKTINEYVNSINNNPLSIEADIKVARRFEESLRIKHEQFIRTLNEYGYSFPDITSMNSSAEGRKYDVANLILITQRLCSNNLKIFEYQENRILSDSKKVSDTKFATVYELYLNRYADAKKITDKKYYIDNWVNFLRSESYFPFSVIPKIADYMLENNIKVFPKINIESFWRDLPNPNHENAPDLPSYQILSHESFVPDYFKQTVLPNGYPYYKFIQSIRFYETTIISQLMNFSKSYFKPYFDNDSKYIDDLYEFCTKEYPIIEWHKRNSFFVDENKSKLNRPKIKLARSIIDAFTPKNTPVACTQENI